MSNDIMSTPFLMASDPVREAYLERLRDEFAMAAMQMKFGEKNSSIDIKQMAEICYRMADAMMEAKKRE